MIEWMADLGSHCRIVLPIVVGVLMLQGIVGLVPHQHNVATVRTVVGLADHWCSRDAAEVFPVAEVHVPAPCLACLVPAPAFDRTVTLPATATGPSEFDEPSLSDKPSSPARHWRRQLRAPPFHA